MIFDVDGTRGWRL